MSTDFAPPLRPDREKLLSVADAVLAIDIPEVSASAKEAAESIFIALNETAARIHAIAANLQ